MQILLLLGPRLRGLRNRWRRADRGERGTAVLFAISGVLFWIAIFAGVGWLVNAFHQVEVFGPILTRKLMELLLLGLFGLLLFSNVITALSSFYLADDLELVLSLPVARPTFHAARLIETIAQSSWMVLVFGVPVFIVYGLVYRAGLVYYLAIPVVMGAFVLIPASVGVGVASVLVSSFPARRIREVLALVGVVALVALFVAFRLLRPERLMDAARFENLAAYVAAIQAPIPLLAPPRWASDILLALLSERAFPWLEFGLLLTGAGAVSGLGRWVTAALYDRGRASAQEARAARLARAGWLDRVLAVATRPLPPAAAAVVEKDVKTFFRDPAQWSQVFLLAAIAVIVVVSVAALPSNQYHGGMAGIFRAVVTFLLLGMLGFVMAAVAARFQFPAVSAEGRAFWIVRTGPLSPRSFLVAKAWPGMVPMLVIGEVIAIASTGILHTGPFLMGVAAWTAFILAFGISGVAVGLGAMYPDFRMDNAARAAAGPTGLLFMVAALALVAVVIGLEAVSIYMMESARHMPLSGADWLGVIGPLLIAGAVCAWATVWPIYKSAEVLWAKETI